MFTRRAPAIDEKRIIDFVAQHETLSETSLSLAYKLGVDARVARRTLDELVKAGALHCRTFEDIEPVYYRNPGRRAS
ncbi:MAG TPA: hypothetical protein VFC51_07145 [Chloroflexota bacterium]|nr:hypothetical protein [Chloroflexota bacterium]